jgi:hypothetical protein
MYAGSGSEQPDVPRGKPVKRRLLVAAHSFLIKNLCRTRL